MDGGLGKVLDSQLSILPIPLSALSGLHKLLQPRLLRRWPSSLLLAGPAASKSQLKARTPGEVTPNSSSTLEYWAFRLKGRSLVPVWQTHGHTGLLVGFEPEVFLVLFDLVTDKAMFHEVHSTLEPLHSCGGSLV